MAGKIQIKFEPKGSKALITAINKLAAAQRKLEKSSVKVAQGQHLVNQRVTSNNAHTNKQLGIMKRLQGKFALLRNVLLLYAFGYQILAKSIGSTLSKYAEQEEAEIRLESAFGRNIDSLKAYASGLQEVTRFGDEVILSAQSLLAAYIKDEEMLKRATQATVDLAAAKGLDLKTAADLVGKSIGSSTNALSRYGIAVEGVVGSTTRLDTLTTNIANLYGGAATDQVNTYVGAIDQMKNSMGDAAEKIGEALAPTVISIANALKTAAEAASDFFGNVTETSLETSIRELKELGISTLEFEKNIALRKKASSEEAVLGLQKESVLREVSKSLTQEDLDLRKRIITEQDRITDLYGSEEEANIKINSLRQHQGLLATGYLDTKREEKLAQALIIEQELAELNILKDRKAQNDEGVETVEAQIILYQKLKLANQNLLDIETAITEEKKKTSGSSGPAIVVPVIPSEVINSTLALNTAEIQLMKSSGDINSITAQRGILEEKSIALGDRAALGLIKREKFLAELKVLQAESNDITRQEIDLENALEQVKLRKQLQEETLTGTIISRKTEEEAQLEIIDLQITQLEAKIEKDQENIELQTQLIALQQQRAEVAVNTNDILMGLNNSEIQGIVQVGQEYSKHAKAVTSGFTGLNAAKKKAEMDALKNSKKYQAADAESKKKMEDEVEEKFFQKAKTMFKIEQSLKAADVIMSTTAAASKALTAQLYPLAAWITATGAAQLGIIASTPGPSRVGYQGGGTSGGGGGGGSTHRFAEGGMVGGYPHSQGGTMIEAERGEFIVSRHAVEALGVEALTQMNETGTSGGINVTFNNPILTQDFVETELSDAIKTAVRRGIDFGV